MQRPPTQCAPRQPIDPAELERLLPSLRRLAVYMHTRCALDASRGPEDLVQEAIAALYSGAAWPEGVSLEHVLRRKIRSLATTERRHLAAFPRAPSFALELIATHDEGLETRRDAEAALSWLVRDAWARGDRDTVRMIAAWRLGYEAELPVRSRKIARQRMVRALARYLAEEGDEGPGLEVAA
ncbi:MAG: hypothetical protein HY791_39545 [Deltaproteobacteria bacterium]|nr:hypothetical protein [Deltaproteobacteria bacterium]